MILARLFQSSTFVRLTNEIVQAIQSFARALWCGGISARMKCSMMTCTAIPRASLASFKVHQENSLTFDLLD